MKVDGSINEKNELKCTVGDKSQGLLSTKIDKALSNMLKGEETQLKCSPEYAEGADIDLTLVQVTRKRFRTRLPRRKQSQRMSLRESVSAQQVLSEKVVVKRRGEDDYREVYCCKCCSREQMSSYHIMASVLVRSRRFWNNSPERAHTTTATVQQDAPRDVGLSAIGRRVKVCKVLG